jgi:hypothetical protein
MLRKHGHPGARMMATHRGKLTMTGRGRWTSRSRGCGGAMSLLSAVKAVSSVEGCPRLIVRRRVEKASKTQRVNTIEWKVIWLENQGRCLV